MCPVRRIHADNSKSHLGLLFEYSHRKPIGIFFVNFLPRPEFLGHNSPETTQIPLLGEKQKIQIFFLFLSFCIIKPLCYPSVFHQSSLSAVAWLVGRKRCVCLSKQVPRFITTAKGHWPAGDNHSVLNILPGFASHWGQGICTFPGRASHPPHLGLYRLGSSAYMLHQQYHGRCPCP